MSTAEDRPVGVAWRPTDTLGARLILLRRELGLSQRDAAERAGIPFGQWQGMEDDDRQPRGLDVKVARIAAAFNVDRDWLMWGGPLRDPFTPTPGPGHLPAQSAGTYTDTAHRVRDIFRTRRPSHERTLVTLPTAA